MQKNDNIIIPIEVIAKKLNISTRTLKILDKKILLR